LPENEQPPFARQRILRLKSSVPVPGLVRQVLINCAWRLNHRNGSEGLPAAIARQDDCGRRRSLGHYHAGVIEEVGAGEVFP